MLTSTAFAGFFSGGGIVKWCKPHLDVLHSLNYLNRLQTIISMLQAVFLMYCNSPVNNQISEGHTFKTAKLTNLWPSFPVRIGI